jgi:hypothetical protein
MREIFLVLHDEIEPFSQQVRAILRGSGAPCRISLPPAPTPASTPHVFAAGESHIDGALEHSKRNATRCRRRNANVTAYINNKETVDMANT